MRHAGAQWFTLATEAAVALRTELVPGGFKQSGEIGRERIGIGKAWHRPGGGGEACAGFLAGLAVAKKLKRKSDAGAFVRGDRSVQAGGFEERCFRLGSESEDGHAGFQREGGRRTSQVGG
jgi:hypothetical protein